MEFRKKAVLCLAALGGALLLQQGADAQGGARPDVVEVQKLTVNVLQLQQQVTALKADVAALQASNNQLKSQVANQEQGMKPLWSQVNQDNKRIADLKDAQTKMELAQTKMLDAYKKHSHKYQHFIPKGGVGPGDQWANGDTGWPSLTP
ncbi:MAG: hypothetical protein EB084_22450 [Proteobacteria bacterium]|nr:hypothetical protein [Pseudomonadota bacterium]